MFFDFTKLLSQAVNNLLISGDAYELNSLIEEQLVDSTIRTKFKEYFSNFSISDLYADLLDLLNTAELHENTDLYLYLCDVRFQKMTYPLFYIPLKADRTTKTITLNIDLPLYINKKAIELSNYTTPKVV